MSGKPKPLADRFWKKVSITDDDRCWMWNAALNAEGGYGVFWDGNRIQTAHRVAWIIANGRQIPEGLVICHRCDVRRCCNPSHLFLGTTQDNIADKVAKGRQSWGHGPKPLMKLTIAQIEEIKAHRRSGRTLASIAKEYGIAFQYVGRICAGKVVAAKDRRIA